MDVNAINNSAISGLSNNSSLQLNKTSSAKIDNFQNESLNLTISNYNIQRSEFAQNIQSLNDGIAASNISMNSIEKQQEYLNNIQDKLQNSENLENKNDIRKSINEDLISFNQIAYNTKYKNENLLVTQKEDNNSITIDTNSQTFSTSKTNTAEFTNSIFNAVNNKDLNISGNLENAINTVTSSSNELDNAYNKFSEFSNQLKNSAKEDISKQFELYNQKSTENINFGKEANDFSKTNINANAGYLAAAQANIVQEQSIRLLS
ncbi:hypothetical protein N5915_05260 [Arcobacter lacus]|uniref:hypothetical protein n=1 Tax=Arcobacter lacus TaxID=1912876 RepID=UPI0021BB6187|nr:hypothetical protein [Arcobacter lacus]MCT7908960.1 hypothetical protein [Arcobacter lacus]